jgi:putative selenate reductase
VGDRPDADSYRQLGVEADPRGRVVTDASLHSEVEGVYIAGDGRTGASTVVRCIAEGRKAAESVMQAIGLKAIVQENVPDVPAERRRKEVNARKARITMPLEKPFDRKNPSAFARREGERCLECSYVCDKCVDVCPNRANVSIPVDVSAEPLFRDPAQIIHLDAYCNECGNCGHFCPWTTGVPYRDKPTVFSSRFDFFHSENSGWLLEGDILIWRMGEDTGETRLVGGRVLKIPDINGAERFFRLLEIVYRYRPSLFGKVEI